MTDIKLLSPSSASYSSSEKLNYIQTRNHLMWKKIKSSFYLKSNIVYMIYSIGMLLIDYCGWNVDIQNLNYVIFGFVHLCNAIMYLYVWVDSGRSIYTWFVLADWLNVLGAFLYLITAFLYPYEYTSDDDNADYTSLFATVRYLELIASFVEVIAALGWNYQWYVVYIEEYQTSRHTTIGRGLTLDDPDLWANITINIGAMYYFYYNVSLFVMKFDNYDTNYLFVTGDIFYFLNSLIYTIASLRDCDLFWYLPTAGIWPDYPPIMLTIQGDTFKMNHFNQDERIFPNKSSDERTQQSINPILSIEEGEHSSSADPQTQLPTQTPTPTETS